MMQKIWSINKKMMKKRLLVLVNTFILAACSQNIQEMPKTSPVAEKLDPYKFTSDFDHQEKIKVTASRHKIENANLLQEMMNIFIQENTPKPQSLSFKHDRLKAFLKQHDIEVQYEEEGELNLMAKLHDGSDMRVGFEHFSFDKAYKMYLFNIDKNECEYLKQKYLTDSNIAIRVIDNGKEVPCGTPDVPVQMQYFYQEQGNDYFDIEKNKNLAIENMSTPIKMNANVYYSEKTPNNEDFRRGVDYWVNPKTQKVYIGAISQNLCKKIIYQELNAKPMVCSAKQLNIIELK